MADNWYFFDGTRQLGPLGFAELKNLLKLQRSGVEVWREGLTGWVAPADLPELSASPRPPPLPTNSEDQNSSTNIGSAINRPRAHRFDNFVAMNWRGEFSIAMTYWIFGFLANLLAWLVAVIVVAAFRAEDGYEPRSIFFSTFFVWVGILAISMWQTVGVWRSANRHIEQRALLNKKSPWARLAKLAVVLGVLRLVGTFLTTGWPQLLEMGRMSFLDDPDIPSYSIRVMRNGTEAEIAGGFKYGLTDDFSKILDASRQIKVVHLDSLGGRIGEAEKLNRLIRGKTLDTYVSANCMSACTIAFAGGAHRVIRKGAILGFHAPSFPRMSQNDLAEEIKDQKEIFLAAGFDKKFVDQALSTPSTELWKPTAGVLLQAKVITSVSDGTDYAISGLGAPRAKEEFASILAKALPLLTILRAKYPSDYDALVQTYYDSFTNGRTEEESIAAGRAGLQTILKRLRPLADDSVLVEVSAIFADQYAALGTKSSTLCYQYASGLDGEKVLTSDIPDSLLKRENEINERVVETAAYRPETNAAQAEDLWKKIGILMASKGVKSEQFDLLTEATIPPSKYADYCFVATSLFREVSKLPQNEAGVLMREILTDK